MAAPTWASPSFNFTASSAMLTKTSGDNTSPDARTRTVEQLSGAGSFEFSLDAATVAVVGLTNLLPGTGTEMYLAMTHAVVFGGFATVEFRELGVYKTDIAQPTGQRNTWKIEVFDAGGGVFNVRVKMNGVTQWTSATAFSGPKAVGVVMTTLNATATLLDIVGGTAPNEAPVVTVGPDQTVAPATVVNLTGSATDDGLPSNTLTYAWSKVSGPGTVTFGNAAAANTTASFNANGVYVLRLTVSDGALSGHADVIITVAVVPTEPVAPLTYNLRTDATVELLPALPAFGPAGSVVRDPTFGTPITRITDETTNADHRSWGTPSGPATNAWASDDSRFFINDESSTYRFYQLDKITRAVTFDHEIAMGTEPSFARPIGKYTKTYGCQLSNDLAVKVYDVVTKSWSTLYDLKTDVPGAVAYQGACYVSHKPKEYIVLAFNGQQETWRYCTIVNPDNVNGDRITIDCNLAKMKVNGGAWQDILNHDGTTATFSGGFGLHSVNISRTGTWVWLGRSGPASHVVFFNTSTKRAHEVNDNKWLGHSSMGFDYFVSMNAVDSGDIPFQWLLTDLSQGGLFPTYRRLIQPSESPGEWNATDHSSWNNARSDALAPIITETQMVWPGIGGPAQTANMANWRALWECVAAIATASGKTPGTNAYYRACHHRMAQVNAQGVYVYSFRDSPRVQASHDGMFVLFTSNWGLSLGVDPQLAALAPANQRRDAFMVYMDQSVLDVVPQGEPSPDLYPVLANTITVDSGRRTGTISPVDTIDQLLTEGMGMDFELYKGAGMILRFTLNPVQNVTGWTGGATFRPAGQPPFTSPLEVVDGVGGVIQFTVTEGQSEGLTVGKIGWDAWRTDTGHRTILVKPSKVTILPSVTYL